MEVYANLKAKNLSVRVVSVPCVELFNKQSYEYKNSVKGGARLSVAIEAGSELGWHKIIGSDGLFFGMESFGASAPAKDLFNHFGLTVEAISSSITHRLKK